MRAPRLDMPGMWWHLCGAAAPRPPPILRGGRRERGRARARACRRRRRRRRRYARADARAGARCKSRPTHARSNGRNTKGYSSTYLAMGFANVRAGTWHRLRRTTKSRPNVLECERPHTGCAWRGQLEPPSTCHVGPTQDLADLRQACSVTRTTAALACVSTTLVGDGTRPALTLHSGLQNVQSPPTPNTRLQFRLKWGVPIPYIRHENQIPRSESGNLTLPHFLTPKLVPRSG